MKKNNTTKNERRGDLIAENDASRLANEVYNVIKHYHDIAQRAIRKAERTEKQVRSDVTNEYAMENECLRRELKYSVACVHSDMELEAYNKFVEDHQKCQLNFKIDSGRMPYVVQVGTGVGVCTKVCCPICGAVTDITDMSIW